MVNLRNQTSHKINWIMIDKSRNQMRNMMRFFSLLLGIALISSCARNDYVTNAYNYKAVNHHHVAIMPYEMIMNGRIPKDLTEEMIMEIEESESKAFQVSLFNMIHRPQTSGRNPITVSFQHYDKTNALLSDAGLSLRDSWYQPAEVLCDILGVDAVIKSRVEKTRFLSEEASYGISAASDLFGRVSGQYIPVPSSRTNEVRLSSSVLDGEEGIPVWVYSDYAYAFWNLPPNEVVDRINRNIANRFPYRER